MTTKKFIPLKDLQFITKLNYKIKCYGRRYDIQPNWTQPNDTQENFLYLDALQKGLFAVLMSTFILCNSDRCHSDEYH
jgi:hypothetical protein